jgi:hypothetical protein
MSTSSVSLPGLRSRRIRFGARALTWPRPELVALLALSAVLYLWALDRNGFANEYSTRTRASSNGSRLC